MDQNGLNKIIQQITDNKNIFLVFVVVLFFVIAAVILFGDYSSKFESYKKQNQSKMEKVSLLGEFNRSKEALDVFLKSRPKTLEGNELVSKIEEYAVANHINIIDITSRDPQRYDVYMTTAIRMNMNAKSFKELVSFLNKVETSNYALRVESLSVKAKSPNDGSFNCEVNIVATQMKL